MIGEVTIFSAVHNESAFGRNSGSEQARSAASQSQKAVAVAEAAVLKNEPQLGVKSNEKPREHHADDQEEQRERGAEDEEARQEPRELEAPNLREEDGLPMGAVSDPEPRGRHPSRADTVELSERARAERAERADGEKKEARYNQSAQVVRRNLSQDAMLPRAPSTAEMREAVQAQQRSLRERNDRLEQMDEQRIDRIEANREDTPRTEMIRQANHEAMTQEYLLEHAAPGTEQHLEYKAGQTSPEPGRVMERYRSANEDSAVETGQDPAKQIFFVVV